VFIKLRLMERWTIFPGDTVQQARLAQVAPLFFLRSTLAANGRPCFEAVITEGDAVLDIFKAIIG